MLLEHFYLHDLLQHPKSVAVPNAWSYNQYFIILYGDGYSNRYQTLTDTNWCLRNEVELTLFQFIQNSFLLRVKILTKLSSFRLNVGLETVFYLMQFVLPYTDNEDDCIDEGIDEGYKRWDDEHDEAIETKEFDFVLEVCMYMCL